MTFDILPTDTFTPLPRFGAGGGAPSFRVASGQVVSLGRVIVPKAARPVVPRLSKYLAAMAAVPLPDEWNRLYEKAKGGFGPDPLGNNSAGNCVVVCKFRAAAGKSANDPDSGGMIAGNTSEALSAYRTICGHLGNDSGCIPTEVLDYQKRVGITMAGKLVKIDGYVAVDGRDRNEVKTACILFGGLDVSFMVDASFMNNVREGAVWRRPASPRIVGGHCVYAFGFDKEGVYLATWGMWVKAEWALFEDARFFDENYAVLEPAWYGKDAIAGNGFPVQTLRDDLDKLDDPVLPPWQPEPGPGPTPPPPGPNPPPPVPLPAESVSFGVRVNGSQLSAVAKFAAGSKTTNDVAGSASRTSAGGGGQSLEDAGLQIVTAALADMGLAGKVNPLDIFGDVMAIWMAYTSGNWPALIPAVLKLLKDLGIKVPS